MVSALSRIVTWAKFSDGYAEMFNRRDRCQDTRHALAAGNGARALRPLRFSPLMPSLDHRMPQFARGRQAAIFDFGDHRNIQRRARRPDPLWDRSRLGYPRPLSGPTSPGFCCSGEVRDGCIKKAPRSFKAGAKVWTRDAPAAGWQAGNHGTREGRCSSARPVIAFAQPQPHPSPK